MSSDWYPIIDEGKCMDNCYKCYNFCPQKVFVKKDSKAAVKNPDACLKGCDSCKDICPVQAICFIMTRTVDVDGVKVGIIGLDEIFHNNKGDFDTAFKQICQRNYVPEEMKIPLKTALKKEFVAIS